MYIISKLGIVQSLISEKWGDYVVPLKTGGENS